MDGNFSQKIFRLSILIVALIFSNLSGTFALVEVEPPTTNAKANNSSQGDRGCQTGSGSPTPLKSTFKNPIVPWSDPHGVSIYHHTDGMYYLASIYPHQQQKTNRGHSIFIMRSPHLHDWTGAFEQRKTVFNLSSDLSNIWLFGPTLQHLDGGWYIYFTMEVDEQPHTSKQFVIGAKTGANPMEAEFGDAVRLKAPGSPDDEADLTGAVLEYGSRDNSKDLYFIWRRLPYQQRFNFTGQKIDLGIYIAPMSNPMEISGSAVLLKIGAGIRGGLLFLNSHLKNLIQYDSAFIFFSPRVGCTQLLKLDHGFHPLVEENWKEVSNEECALASNEKQGVFSVSPHNLVTAPDGMETWFVYRASESFTDPGKTRSNRAEKIAWNRKTGNPIFPRPAGLKLSLRAPKENMRRPTILPYPYPALRQSSPCPGAQVQLPVVLPPSLPDSAKTNDKIASGGLGKARQPTEHVIDLVRRLTPQIHAEVCKQAGDSASCQTEENSAAPLSVIEYKSQTVSGTNYFVKVRRGTGVWHLRIYEQTWTNTLQLSGAEGPKEETKEIGYF